MCCALLGERFDIHGGGVDLQFPHHENEIAQSEGANGQPLRHATGCTTASSTSTTRRCPSRWATSSPSATCCKHYDGETVRFFMLRAHYRSPLNYSDAHLDDARSALRRLYTALDAVARRRRTPIDWSEPRRRAFKAAMDDDFSTPEAVAVLFDLAAEVNRSRVAADCRRCSRRWAARWACCSRRRGSYPAGRRRCLRRSGHIAGRRSRRARPAKAATNFAEADRIRDALAGAGHRAQGLAAGHHLGQGLTALASDASRHDARDAEPRHARLLGRGLQAPDAEGPGDEAADPAVRRGAACRPAATPSRRWRAASSASRSRSRRRRRCGTASPRCCGAAHQAWRQRRCWRWTRSTTCGRPACRRARSSTWSTWRCISTPARCTCDAVGGDGRRGHHRGAGGHPRHRPLDGRDVPDLSPDAAQRAAAGRRGPDQRHQPELFHRRAGVAAEAREVGDAWAPFRSVATWYIWRSLDPLPVDY